ncbi:MAG: DUF3572 domain-containing protein [Hyphomicrobiaceae bacterium]|nr:DUF3572 domain-containing protein [Hyphomicrobiaceae bacterium]
MKTRVKGPDREAAETAALRGLGFLAGDPERLGRFLSLTGMGPAELRAGARDPAMLAGVLEYLLGDETLLLVFTSEAGIAPESIAQCHHVLTRNGAAGGSA